MSQSEEGFGFEMDEEFIKENQKALQHVVNGFSRILILWIIKNNKKIHGYGIMKELDGFFELQIEKNIIKKFPSSKVYPILKSFEKADMIIGEWKVVENKKIKYYSITEKGEALLNFISKQHQSFKQYSQWKLFLSDFYGLN